MVTTATEPALEGNPKLVGVSGWLLFWVLSTAVSVVGSLASLGAAQETPPFWVPLFLLLALAGAGAIFAVLWLRNHWGPRLARGYMVLVLGAVIIAVAPLLISGGAVSRVLGVSSLVSAVAYNLIWQSYFSRSKRVRATYYSALSRRPAIALAQLACVILWVISFGLLGSASGSLWELAPGRARRIVLDVVAQGNAVVSQNDTQATADQIRRRLEALGVPSPIAHPREGVPSQVELVVPVTGPGSLYGSVVTRRGLLEFRSVAAGPFATRSEAQAALAATSPSIAEVLSALGDEQYYVCATTPILTGDAVQYARSTLDSERRPNVSLTLTAAAGKRMREFTRAHLGKQIAIVLDREVYSAPTIREEIGENLQISGSFDARAASDLAAVLRSGHALPHPVRIAEEQIISSRRWLARQALWAAGFAFLLLATIAMLVNRAHAEARLAALVQPAI